MNGVLSAQDIRKLIQARVITAKTRIEDSQVQPATLDLRLGAKGYRVLASRRPQPGETMDDLLSHSMYELNLNIHHYLEVGHKYLFELQENIRLSDVTPDSKISDFSADSQENEAALGFSLKDLRVYANNKSSSGRVNLEVKLVTHAGYDVLNSTHSEDKLYVEVTPKSFPIRVNKGDKLNQVRFYVGDSRVSDPQLKSLWHGQPLLFDKSERPVLNPDRFIQNGLIVHADLDGHAGWVARKDVQEAVDFANINHYDPFDFFDPIRLNKNNELILREGEFYIVSSKECLSVPTPYCAEMIPYDLTSGGQFRSHYAGFFDPGWGFGREGETKGTQATLEVIPHDTISIRDGQVICKFVFEKMLSVPEVAYGADPVLRSNYFGQKGPTLSKHFKRVTAEPNSLQPKASGLSLPALNPAER